MTEQAQLEVLRTATIDLKELTMRNLMDAQRLARAPDTASVKYTHINYGLYKVEFEWTD